MSLTSRKHNDGAYPQMDVIYALDDRFSVLTGVSIYSLCVNNAEEFETIRIHILDAGICDENKVKLSTVTEKYSNVKVSFYSDIDTSLIEKYPLRGDWTLATYLRLIMPSILPNDVEKCLYIDGDTVVCGSLQEMYSVDLKDDMLAGTLDFFMFDDSLDHPYVNAGVLIVDMKKWRDEDITSELIAYGDNNAGALFWQDQDILNSVIESKRILPPKYNNIGCYYSIRKRLSKAFVNYYGKEAIIEARTNPAIIHYMGYHYFHGLFPVLKREYREFRRYKSASAYKDAPDMMARKRFGRLAIMFYWINFVSPIPFKYPFDLLMRFFHASKTRF